MKFTTKANQVLEVNPVSQASIDAAKALAPGEGIGPAIAADLINKIASGEITNMSQMPDEYRKLGESCGLPSAQGNAPLQPPFLAFIDELPFFGNETTPNAKSTCNGMSAMSDMLTAAMLKANGKPFVFINGKSDFGALEEIQKTIVNFDPNRTHTLVFGPTSKGKSCFVNEHLQTLERYQAAMQAGRLMSTKDNANFLRSLYQYAQMAAVPNKAIPAPDPSLLPGKKLRHQPRPKPYYHQFNSNKF